MHRWSRTMTLLTVACFSATLVVGCATASKGAQKIRITKLDDLPRHTYPISGKVVDLIQSQAQVAELAKRVRANIEADLDAYEINDATTLKKMYGTLLTIDMFEGHNESALAHIVQIRALEDKEAAKLMTGLSAQAMIAARREVGPDAPAADFKRAFANQLTDRVAKLPWKIVQDDIQESKGRMEIMSENLLMGIIQARYEPVVAKTGELNADQAAGLVSMHYLINERLPLKDEYIAVYQRAIDANKVVKPDIWADRSITLSADQKLTPVLLGVWDSGTDVAIFKGRVFVNPNEKPDGTDTDGNGWIDDIHGVAFDYHAQRATGALKPLGEAAERMPQIMKHMKGFMDSLSAVDSPKSAALKKYLSSLNPNDVQGFLEDLSLAGGYCHGTHVAGIMAEGNPFARLLIGRHSYDHHMVPVVRDLEWGQRDALKCRDTVEYFKQHGVRVVNMSWGEAQQDAEDSLEANGIGENAEERREIAREVFALQREGLYEAIKNAPDILFVCAAGNADNDVEFDEYIASSFELPNLVTVGAVDQAGDPTSFTSFGRTVQVYANGFEVDSYVPGGERMKMSGTSMASPNAANLAGKLLALDPTLTPPQIIKLIKEGADQRTEGGQSFLLLNPKRTVSLLK